MAQSTLMVYTAPTTVKFFYNDGHTLFIVKNASGAPITCTIDSVALCNQGVDHDIVVTVTNAQEREIGPLDPARFNDGGSNVKMTFSAVVSVTVGQAFLAK
jgi:hypothetical protein